MQAFARRRNVEPTNSCSKTLLARQHALLASRLAILKASCVCHLPIKLANAKDLSLEQRTSALRTLPCATFTTRTMKRPSANS